VKKPIFATILFLFTFQISPSEAGLTAIWDFGPDAAGYTEDVTLSNVTGVPTIFLSGGEKDDNGKDGTAYTDAAGNFHAGGQAAAWDDIKVDGPDAKWTLTINTTGWYDLAIRWDYKAWEPETNSFDLDYRVGGIGDWVVILNNESIVGDETYHSFSYDLSSIANIENQSIVEFCFYDLDRNGNKKFAFDNLEITGVPEPTTFILFGLTGLVLMRRRST